MITSDDIKAFRKERKLSQDDLAKTIGVTRELINKIETGKLPISRVNEMIFAKLFSENISHEYTLNEPSPTYGTITKSPQGKFPKKVGIGFKPVPYFDVDFTAGDIEVYDDHNALQPAYMMDIPEFSGCTAFRVFSNSMERLIVSGSILFGTKVSDWMDHLEYGQIYGIVCNDKRRYLKYIRKAPQKDETHFLLKSENVEEFDDFLMPKSKIKSIWLIHGWLNKRA